MTRYVVVGGAGFIGSHVAAALLCEPDAAVTVYDNFSSGRAWHLPPAHPGLRVVRGDVRDLPFLTESMRGHDHVYHFASNPDIARAAREPTIDFWEGTYLTQNVLEAARVAGARRLTYASGSGVYGDVGHTPVFENLSPLRPTSTYGASKLAGESLICAYCEMFGLSALAFRFANVVGPHQTHGVAYDFVRRLLADPTNLSILGDGTQSKSYVHVDDVVGAMRYLAARLPADRGAGGFDVYNVATQDYATVRQIAELVVERLGLANVRFAFGNSPRGWKGDVPVVRFDTTKARATGWANARTSVEALRDSIDSMIADARAGRFADAKA
jgi:UDP-glucose 4-epimerase